MMWELWTVYHAEMPQFLAEFAETPPMQRLKDVGMNCGCEYTSFPRFSGIRPYSRFDHSVGVALIVWHFTGSMEQALAGLFHDVTTPVFAHVVDFLNGDHMRQESTEAGIAECLAASKEVCELLRKYGISIEQVADYHVYPIADNDSPALSADRLEYTMGNLWNYGFANLDEIRSAYEDLAVGCDETGETELVFRTPEAASWFAGSALKTSRVYIADEDRFAMQALADLLRRAMDRKIVQDQDLWTTETEVLMRLSMDPVCSAEWEALRRYERIVCYEEEPEGEYAVRIGAKKRWIDPIAAGKGRVSSWDGAVAEEMAELRAIRFDKWLSGRTKEAWP